MEYVRFGRTGLEVSRICMGCMSFGTPDAKRPWVLQDDAARPLFRQAWESGITFFDNANIYAMGTSEELTGRLLKELGSRDQYVLATKLYNRMAPGPNGAGLSRKAIFSELDKSLKRLGTDYVDLYQIHRFDHFTPIEETLEALHDVVKAGKVRYIGASSMFAWQFAKMLFTAEKHGWTRFISMQSEVHLAMREEEREMLPLCTDQGVAVMPWGPLGGGRLTRPWGEQTLRNTTDLFNKTMYADPESGGKTIVDAVEKVAKARGVPMAQIAMAWMLQNPSVTTPIIGATKANHIQDAVDALSVKLSADEVATLEGPYQPRPVPHYLGQGDALGRGRVWQDPA
ncbi:MAG: aldo/keto reductase [Cypionkella sp.]